jgi:hypothetical protein
LGSFNFTATTNDQAYIGSMWAKTIYTPDKCMVDPLSSPTCPGYAKAMATQSASTTTTTTTTAVTADPIPVTTTTVVTTTTSPTSTTSTSTSPTSTTVADVAQPVATTTTTSTSTSTASAPVTSSTTTAATSATPSATNPQPKIGEVTTAGSQPSTSKSTVSTSQILSIVGGEQSRLNKLETATATAAVEQAKADAAKVTNEAQSIAATVQSTSAANAQATITSLTQSATSTAGAAAGPAFSGTGINLFAPQTSVVSIGALRTPENYSFNSQSYSSGSGISFASVTPAVSYSLRREEERRNQEIQTVNETKQLIGPTNPLSNSMTPPSLPTALPPAPTGPSVNAKVKDNDAAGGVSIASIAKQPQGFELYMGGMADRPFYAPKEIYKGQKVVDNARAQRMLNGASDRLHQEMVDQQYKLLQGN